MSMPNRKLRSVGAWVLWLCASAASAAIAHAQSELSALVAADGRLDLFVVGADASVEHREQANPDATLTVEPLGGEARAVSATRLADGSVEVFVVGSDDAVWHITQAPGTAAWGDWRSLGGQAKRVAAVSAADTVTLFGIGADGAIWQRSRAGAAGAWTAPQSLGFKASRLAAVALDQGAIALFALGDDAAVWQAAFDPAAVSGTTWQPLGAEASDLAAAHAPGGELAVAVVGSDSAVWQLRAREGAWTGWERIGGAAQRVALAQSPGTLALFTLDSAGAVARASLGETDAWSAFAPLTAAQTAPSTPVETPASATPPSNPIGPAARGPLQATFTGNVALQIPSVNVAASRQITLGLTFDADRQHVSITSFPAITTDTFSTPLGSTNSTVTLIGGGAGTFDPSTGKLDIPVKLHFDQSIDIPLINADVDADFDLSTQQAGGAPLDRSSGALALGATGTFTGSGLNPLAGAAADLVIAGAIDPTP